MLFDMLILFIIITVIMFILTLYTLEENPHLSIAFITLGLVFSILCTYGLWNVEYMYIGYNASNGTTEGVTYSTINYGDPYSYIFVLIFFIFGILLMKAAFNAWNQALEQKGEMEYNNKGKYWK